MMKSFSTDAKLIPCDCGGVRRVGCHSNCCATARRAECRASFAKGRRHVQPWTRHVPVTTVRSQAFGRVQGGQAPVASEHQSAESVAAWRQTFVYPSQSPPSSEDAKSALDSLAAQRPKDSP